MDLLIPRSAPVAPRSWHLFEFLKVACPLDRPGRKGFYGKIGKKYNNGKNQAKTTKTKRSWITVCGFNSMFPRCSSFKFVIKSLKPLSRIKRLIHLISGPVMRAIMQLQLARVITDKAFSSAAAWSGALRGFRQTHSPKSRNIFGIPRGNDKLHFKY